MRRDWVLPFRLLLLWEEFLYNNVHYSVFSFSMNFHKVVDPPDLCEHWRCLNLGQERKVENALSLHPLETTFSNTVLGNFSTHDSGPVA